MRVDPSLRSKARPAFAGHSWLAAVVPADARRFRVQNPDLAYTLRAAGAELVEDGADVEIGSPDSLDGTAPLAVVPLNERLSESPSRAGRVVRRLLKSADVTRRAAGIERRLRARRYEQVSVFWWDVEHVLRRRGEAASERGSAATWFPRRALIVASRGAVGPSPLQLALEAAVPDARGRLELEPPFVRSGALMIISEGGVLRVALGPATRQVEAQARTLESLAQAGAPADVLGRAPALLAKGSAGLARWSLEERLEGDPAPPSPGSAFLEECREFLVGLHGVAGGEAPPPPTAQAETVASATRGEAVRRVLAVGRAVEAAADDLPLGWGHGDFWTGNILIGPAGITGILDWEVAGGARLPLLDLLQLRLTATQADVYWGAAVADYLIPLARSGGDGLTVGYLRRLGIEPRARLIERLVAAYWLQRVSYQLGLYRDRAADAQWVTRNVERVLPHLEGI